MTKIEKSGDLNSDRPTAAAINSYILKICLLFIFGSKK